MLNEDELSVLDIDLNEIREAAKINALNDIDMKFMSEILFEQRMPKDNMLVVTSKDKFHGASRIFCDGVIDEIHKKFDNKKIIMLPSSIHEVICVPSITEDLNELKAIVEDVNKNSLQDNEYLSDNVYVHTDGEGWSIFNEFIKSKDSESLDKDEPDICDN